MLKVSTSLKSYLSRISISKICLVILIPIFSACVQSDRAELESTSEEASNYLQETQTIPTSNPEKPSSSPTFPPEVESPETNTPESLPTVTPPTPLDGSGGGIIVFVATEFDGGDLFLMNADGSGRLRLTRSSEVESHPDWSPDSTRIVYSAESDDLESEIYIMEIEIPLPDVEVFDAMQITNNDTRDRKPAWSPDGARIVFETDRDGNLEIYSMTANGEDALRLTNDPMSDIEPSWSPDGSQIAFVSNRDGDWEIYLIDANGENLQQLTHNRYSDRLPAWSPDGRLIAFASTRNANQDIYVINAPVGDEGKISSELRLTTNPAEDLNPFWSPDGSFIVFSRNHTLDNTPGIYVLALNSRDEQWLVLAEPGFASWRP